MTKPNSSLVMSNLNKVQYISAGAGSGKTYSITEKIVEAFEQDDTLKPKHLIVTTFTRKAAAELRQRVSEKLIERQMFDHLGQINEARIGTVHSICQEFLSIYGALVNIQSNFSVLEEDQKNDLLVELTEDHVTEELLELLRRFKSSESEGYLRRAVLNILSKAHSYQLSDAQLQDSLVASKRKIAQALGEVVPEVTVESIEKEWKKAYTGLENLSLSEELRGDSKRFFDRLRSGLRQIESNRRPTYNDMLGLSKMGIKKAHQSIIEDLQSLLTRHIHMAEFHSDYEQMIDHVFDLALKVKSEYTNIKRSKGLLDYDDMEAYMVALLDNSVFQNEFESKIRMVLVDEFQDTNPVQLKIFNEWLKYVDNAVWVGDIKQSIYQFRGTDTQLIEQLIAQLDDDRIERLPYSYRSRNELVTAASTYFTEVFKGEIVEEVVLKSSPLNAGNREDCLPPLLTFTSRGKNEDHFDAIANYVSLIIQDGHKILAKNAKNPRAVKGSDICVLARTNNHANIINDLLRSSYGMETANFSSTFYKEDVWKLIDAVFGILINPNSVWDKYIIRFLSEDEGDAGKTLKHRLDKLVDEEDSDFFSPISSLEKGIKDTWKRYRHLPLSDLLSSLLTETELDTTLQHLDGSINSGRIAEGLIACTQLYEETSAILGRPQSLQGLRVHLGKKLLNSLNELSLEGVSVMTYHKAKGLEWPVVLMTSLNSSATTRYFDTPHHDEGKLIYIPSPYNSKTTTSEIHTRFEKELEKELISEFKQEKRLLYVGFTRGRESIVFHDPGNMPWLDRSLNLKPEVVSQDAWKILVEQPGIKLTSLYPELFPLHPIKSKRILPKRRGSANSEFEPYFVRPSSMRADNSNYLFGKFVELGEYLPPVNAPTAEQEAPFGDLVHQFLGYDNSPGSMIESYGLTNLINEGILTEWKSRLFDWIEKNYPGAQVHQELMFSTAVNGQRIEGIADLVVETEQELIIIDHKTYPGSRAQLQQRIQEKGYADQILAYRAALERLFDKPANCWLYFPISSTLVPVKPKPLES